MSLNRCGKQVNSRLLNKAKSSDKRYFLFYNLLWLLWILLHIFIVFHYGIELFSAVADSVVSNILLYIFCLIFSNILRFYQPGLKQSLNLIIWTAMLSSAWFMLIRLILPFLLSSDTVFIVFFNTTLLLRLVISVLLIGGSMLMMWVWQNFKNREQENLRYSQMIQLAREAELNSLRQQMQPHFLFNSLNSISALSVSDPPQAREMIIRLSDFLRATLSKNNDDLILFDDEIKQLGLYLEIEKLRFGHRLQTRFEISEQCSDKKLPPMMLQTLLENAIKHGLYGTTEHVNINISARCDNELLEIIVENPFDPLHSPSGAGFGLDTLKRRLFLIYNRSDLLGIEKKESVFKTTLKIPQLKP